MFESLEVEIQVFILEIAHGDQLEKILCCLSLLLCYSSLLSLSS